MQSVILGTAQWGLDYGVTNPAGPPVGRCDPGELVAAARDAGIGSLDTAPAYGDAEERIGRAAPTASPSRPRCPSRDRRPRRSPASVAASLGRVRRRTTRARSWSMTGTSASPRARIDGRPAPSSSCGTDGARRVGRRLRVRRGGPRLGARRPSSAWTSSRCRSASSTSGSTARRRSPSCGRRGGRVQARSIFLQGAAVAADDHSGFGTHPDVVRLRSQRGPIALAPVPRLRRARARGSTRWCVAATTAAELSEIMAAIAEPCPADVDWSAFASVGPAAGRSATVDCAESREMTHVTTLGHPAGADDIDPTAGQGARSRSWASR